MAVKSDYPFPGLIGWIATFLVVVIFDVWASKTNHPTMSRTLGHYLTRDVTGPILAGAWMGLGYHLLIDERFAAVDDVLLTAKSFSDITSPPSEL